MAYQTLYRKYRPNSFDYVYGQDVIVKTIKNVIKSNKLSHAYLFTGPRGTGKTSCAKLFAKAVNCLNNNNGDACNNCLNCKSYNDNSNPDIIEIDAASNNGVDEIREIKNKINLVPSMSKYKVYIIDEVHMLSIGAFNALLKTLEEPPEYVIFILATTEPQKIPATIISRCQRFDFKEISSLKMKECLKMITEKEKINIDEEGLDEIILNAKGGMRDALSLLDQSYAFCDEKITKKNIEELSGNISDDNVKKIITNIINNDYKNIIEQINSFDEEGKDFIIILEKIINFLQTAIIYKKTSSMNINNEQNKLFFDTLNEKDIYNLFDNLNNIYNKMQYSKFKKTFFEISILELIDEKKENNLAKEKNIKDNVSRETLIIQKEQVNNNDEYNKKLDELKNIRINNILKDATKDNLNFINDMWNNLNDYLINDKYRKCSGILLEGKPLAVNNNGIIISFPNQTLLDNIEEKYDISKELIKEIYNQNYKIVYVTDEYWKKIRPYYVEKVKNKELELKDEEYILSQLKKIIQKNTINEFDELIVMEE